MSTLMSTLPRLSDEQWTRLRKEIAEHNATHQPYILLPDSVYELETEVEDLEAKLLQVRHLVEYVWECDGSPVRMPTPREIADDLDKILDPPEVKDESTTTDGG